MYQVVKVLNNNAFLARQGEDERILLGKGIGFGKKTGDFFQPIANAKVYTLASAGDSNVASGAVREIDPIFLEAAEKIIEEAAKVFCDLNPDILFPLAEHLAFAAKRAEEHMYIANPFVEEIRTLYGREYTIVLQNREEVEAMTGYRISDDEAGFIALYIHSGLADERVSETLKSTQIIDECMLWLEKELKQTIDRESLGGIRLMSHFYYVIARAKNGETINVDLNEFVKKTYPEAGRLAREICRYMADTLNLTIRREEMGFMAVHIQAIMEP